jgi:hypothetical protein
MANTKIPVELSSTPGIVDNSNATAITIDSSEKATFSNSIEATIAYRAYDSVAAAYRNVLRYDSGNVRLETGSGGSEAITAFTGGSERMRIDSSGKVGIGVTPSEALHIEHNTVSGGDNYIHMRKTDQGAGQGAFIGIPTASNNLRIMNHAANSITFHTTTSDAERMRITSTGNVKIKTTNDYYANDLVVSCANNGGITLVGGTSDLQYLMFADGTSGDDRYRGYIEYSHNANHMGFATNGSERMRIDSSGNFLVGTTSTTVGGGGSGVTGFRVDGANGIVQAAASGNTSAIFNRTSSDGDIVSLRKDGTEVGSIGTASGDLNIDGGASHSGIRFQAGSLLPRLNGADANNAIDLGYDDGGSVFRFKNLYLSGALSKGSGSFKIDHPLEAKADTHYLVHSFLEAPQADNIYRGKVDLVDGSATVNIDTVAGMTEGTFVALNTDVQCFTTNESDWDAVKGSVSGNILTISCQNTSSTATVSWLVIGERQDQHMLDTDWTDENGKVIVEPLKGETE